MYGCSKDCLILIPFRLPQISCFPLSLKCFSSVSDNCPNVGIGPLLPFPHPPRSGPVLLTLPFSPLFLNPTEFWVGLYILFHWLGTPVHSHLAFYMHFCVWRCISDASVERDVFHIHLLLRHLVPPQNLNMPQFIFQQSWCQKRDLEDSSMVPRSKKQPGKK